MAKRGRKRKPDGEVSPAALAKRKQREKYGRTGTSSKGINAKLAENKQLRKYRAFLTELDRRNVLYRRILSNQELAKLFTCYQFDNANFLNAKNKRVAKKRKPRKGTREHRIQHFEECGLKPDGDKCPLCGKLRLPNQFTWRIMSNGKFVGVRTPPRCLECQHDINKGVRDEPESE